MRSNNDMRFDEKVVIEVTPQEIAWRVNEILYEYMETLRDQHVGVGNVVQTLDACNMVQEMARRLEPYRTAANKIYDEWHAKNDKKKNKKGKKK